MQIRTGRILVADPYLQDPYFSRSVVLLTSYEQGEQEDCMGFILNRPSNVFIHEVFQDFPEFEALIYLGGPVDTNMLFFIHTLGDQIPESKSIGNNLYFGGDFETLKQLITEGKINSKDIRFFLGYSGWGIDQLDDEIISESWIVGKLKRSYLFKVKTRLVWATALKDNKPSLGFYGKYAFTPSLN